jgi:hypothetical protein
MKKDTGQEFAFAKERKTTTGAAQIAGSGSLKRERGGDL